MGWLRRLPLAEAAMFLYMGAIKMGGPAGNELVQDMVQQSNKLGLDLDRLSPCSALPLLISHTLKERARYTYKEREREKDTHTHTKKERDTKNTPHLYTNMA